MSIQNENSPQISDDGLVEKILNKFVEFDYESKIKFSKADLNILIQNEKMKNMLEYFCDNVKSVDEISITKANIKIFLSNQEKIKKISQLKEKKEKLENELKMKQNSLIKIKEKKEELLKNKKIVLDLVNENKKEEEKILIKSKILKNSNLNFQKLTDEFSNFKFLENYKIFKKINNEKGKIDSEENFSFETFINENHKFFIENYRKENYKNIPKYSQEELNKIQNSFTFNEFILKLKEYLFQLHNFDKDFNKHSELLEINGLLNEEEFRLKYQNILNELKTYYENRQIDMIHKYKSENISEEIQSLQNENLNLIRTFKISDNVLKNLKIFINKKLLDDLEFLIKKETNSKNESCKKIYCQNISNENILKIGIDSSQVINLCKSKLKLFKKYKNRIENFTIRHILPLSNVIEEKFCDFQSSLKIELEYFKNFELSLLKSIKDPNKIYSLKRFNYDKEILRNSSIRKKSEVFKIFFDLIDLNYSEKIFKNSELRLRKSSIKNPNYLKFCLISEKTSEMEIFLEEDFKKIKDNFKEIWKYYGDIINILTDNLKLYRKIVSEWKREDYIKILKTIFEVEFEN